MISRYFIADCRPAEDIAKDANRHPDQVLSFFNIKPGMTVLDLFSGSGYYTEMLNSIVGENGEAEAGFLRNGDDDHTLAVFDPSLRGKTDRFVFKFVRN